MSKARSTQSKNPAPAGTGMLADRIRAALPAAGRSEQPMFGGIGFMLNGNMVAGTFRDQLLVRVGKDQNDEALKRPGARPMEMRGRPFAGYVMVDPASLSDGTLGDWIGLALAHVRTLPPKATKPKPGNPNPARKTGGRK